MANDYVFCAVCGRIFPRTAVTKSGNIPAHGEQWKLCGGSYLPPDGASPYGR